MKSDSRKRFEEKLRMFCFFHLGADARLQVKKETEGLRISIEHHRVKPFEFDLTDACLEELLGDAAKLERFLLEKITPHRR